MSEPAWGLLDELPLVLRCLASELCVEDTTPFHRLRQAADEIERLTETERQFIALQDSLRNKDQQREIERLTRELEHEVSISRRANNRLVDLDTEIERLTRELEMKQLVENRLRLSWDESDKEAKRLRAALEEIVESTDYSMGSTIRNIAREALGEPKP